MDEEIHAAEFHFINIPRLITYRLAPDHNSKHAAECHALPDLGTLGADSLRQQVKILRSAEDDAAVLPVLRNDGEHLRRNVAALIAPEPVLQLVHDDNDALMLDFIVNELPPVRELLILIRKSRV